MILDNMSQAKAFEKATLFREEGERGADRERGWEREEERKRERERERDGGMKQAGNITLVHGPVGSNDS